MILLFLGLGKNMSDKNIILISFILILAIISIPAVMAENTEEININYNQDFDDLMIVDNANLDNQYSINQDDLSDNSLPDWNVADTVSDEEGAFLEDDGVSEIDLGEKESKYPNLGANNLQSTITVDGKAYNQMVNRTIQNAIDSANEGDTINITGKEYSHCHFVVNKRLTIISEVGTVMSPCPGNTNGSGTHGLFYISPEASRTVLMGFSLINKKKKKNDYCIYIKGASDVEIINCTIINTTTGDGIKVLNAQNTTITDSFIKDSNVGINIINSTETTVTNCNITNNTITGINIGANSSSVTIMNNNISYNKKSGVNMSSADHVCILNNFIGYNHNENGDDDTAGIYVNCEIIRIEIVGNYIRENGKHGILNDYRARNLNYSNRNSDKLEYIENNYFIGHTFRLIYHITYNQLFGGEYSYDAANDVYNYVGMGNGDYTKDQAINFLGYNFYYPSEAFCPSIFYNYTDYRNGKVWHSDDSYRLVLSEISQDNKGTYTISIVDKNGKVANNLSSIPVIFYLNKNNTSPDSQSGDICEVVLMKNGTATVTFGYDLFKESGNVVTAVFPNMEENYLVQPITYKSFNVDDSQIPRESVATAITVSKLNTYPNSGVYLTATLKDSKGYPLANRNLTFTLNGNTYVKTTDSNGQAKIQIKLATAKTYALKVSFDGFEEYNGSSANSSIVVKKIAQKITSSNKVYAPKSGDYYTVTLKDSSNKAIAGKKITIKIGTKTYTRTTNNKGQAKVKISIAQKKKYKVIIKSAATSKYTAISKTNYITIKQLVQKIVSSNKVYAPKSVNYFTVTLKDQNNKLLANKKVTVKIGTKTYNKKTNKKGQVKIKVKLSKKKTYKVTIKSPKTSQYKLKTKTNKIVIKALKQKITSANKKYLPQAGTYYSITLRDQNNQLIKSKQVKFTINAKTYSVKTNSKGIAKFKINLVTPKVYKLKIYSPKTSQYVAISKTNNITIEKGTPSLTSYDRTFANGTDGEYCVYLKDYAGKALSNGKISFILNSVTYSASTDSNGMAKFIVNLTEAKDYSLTVKFLGDVKNKAISKSHTIAIKEGENIAFVDGNLPNSEIQRIIDSCSNGNTVEFLGESYGNINLSINKELNVISNVGTTLNGALNSPVIKVNGNNVNISNLKIVANSKSGNSEGILINNSEDINIVNNTISNTLDSSKMDGYDNGSTSLPGYGIDIRNSTNVSIVQNTVSHFESALYNEYSQNLSIRENELKLSNYGIKYGFGSANTEIIGNAIIDNIGWYVMNIPEGPCGYGIYLNNSAVNVTINQNNVSNNYMGISLDANNSTGIVITSNIISENAAEGIRFNAGYDLAEDAIEPIVTDNAIYRNAKGPSMMILGEMSANPFGIYGAGYDTDTDTPHEDLQLHIGPNWYGTNSLTRWNNDTGDIGIGTMCPRIKTTEICFKNVVAKEAGTYEINFTYNNSDVPASNLATFDLYATLNNGTEKQIEVHFDVVNGTGTFSFDKESYLEEGNVLIISTIPLSKESYRTMYSLKFVYNVPDDEIPV